MCLFPCKHFVKYLHTWFEGRKLYVFNNIALFICELICFNHLSGYEWPKMPKISKFI